MTEKAIIITGAAGGLGKATSVAAAELGYGVTLVDLSADALEETRIAVERAGGRAVVATADVSDPIAVQDYVDRARDAFGRIDGFFNNAGINVPAAALIDTQDDDFDRCMSVNVKGVYLGLKSVLPVMMEQGFGSIVNTGSMGSTGGIPGISPYVASKHAVIGLTKTAALEAAKCGVRVNAVLPGNIRTRMMLESTQGSEEEAVALAASLVPQGRVGLPQDIADAVMFLISERSTHVTGIALPVDGGITAQVYPNFEQ